MTEIVPGALSQELDDLLRQHAKRQCLAKKSLLFYRGSTPDALFCLLSGRVRLSVTGATGREALLGVVPPGHWFGEASLFSGEVRAHDAFAEVDSELLLVSASVLHTLIDHRPEYLLEFLRLMGLRYKSTLQRMDGSVLQPLSVRLASKLLAVASESIPAKDCDLQISQENLAQMLGVSRQSINKVLKDWEVQGVVQVSYRSLSLLAPDYLARLAQDESVTSPHL